MIIMLVRLIITSLVLVCTTTAATEQAPTGKVLLDACQAVKANTATEMQTMLCVWYVTPCDCEQEKKQLPTVCLPTSIDETTLVNLVVKDLSKQVDLLESDAEYAANSVLAQYYPCPAR